MGVALAGVMYALVNGRHRRIDDVRADLARQHDDHNRLDERLSRATVTVATLAWVALAATSGSASRTRCAETGARRSRGIFAGVTLGGATLRADRDANERFYGERLDSTQIVLDGETGTAALPEAVTRLREALAEITSDEDHESN